MDHKRRLTPRCRKTGKWVRHPGITFKSSVGRTLSQLSNPLTAKACLANLSRDIIAVPTDEVAQIEECDESKLKEEEVQEAEEHCSHADEEREAESNGNIAREAASAQVALDEHLVPAEIAVQPRKRRIVIAKPKIHADIPICETAEGDNAPLMLHPIKTCERNLQIQKKHQIS